MRVKEEEEEEEKEEEEKEEEEEEEEEERKPGIAVHSLILALRKLRQADLCEFEVRLVYKMRSSSARGMQ